MRQRATVPPEVEADVNFILEEVRRLYTEWDCFEQLYLVAGRRDLRNHAGHMLTVLRIALATDIVMTISRLCDPSTTMNKPNLVFQRFLNDFPQLKPKLAAEIDELNDLYRTQIKPVRNRRLGHNDLVLLRGEENFTSPRIQDLRRAIELCGEIVATLSAELLNRAVSFPRSFVPGELDWIEASL